VTLLAVLVPFALPFFALPGVNFDAARTQETLASDATRLSPFALGLVPFLASFVWVELAALAVPRWRPLRIGGPEGRARLHSAVRRLAYAVCVVQAIALTVYLQRLDILEPGRLVFLGAILSVVAGTLLLVLLTQLLDRHGLGGGFSLMCAAFFLPELWNAAVDVQYWAQVWSGGIDLALWTLVGVVFGSILFLRLRIRQAEGLALPVRLPACGLVPLTSAASWLSFLSVLGSYWQYEPLQDLLVGDAGTIRNVTLVFVLGLLFGALFNRPSKVRMARGVTPPASHAFEDTRLAVAKAVLASTGFVVALQLIERRVGAALGDLPLIGVVPLVMFAAVGLDVREEWRAIRKHGELAAVWPEHRVYAVDKALLALENAGIPAFPRAVHHRTLWHFFAPYIPVVIMVPKSKSEEAGAILRAKMLAAGVAAGG
jgi:hypothetical protein